MMHFYPLGHEPSHVLPASELIPKLRKALADMSRAIRNHVRGQSRELGPGARNSLDFGVEHSMCQARDLLWRSREGTTADIQLYPFALQGLEDAARLFRLDMEASEFWAEFGGTALATEETLIKLDRILADLATWEAADPRSTAQAETAAPQSEAESKHIEPVFDETPTPHRPEIDFKSPAAALRKEGKGNQAKLVEYMVDREEATAEEIAEHLHGDSETSDQAMWNNAKRTTESLALLNSRLSFRFASGRMYREISPA